MAKCKVTSKMVKIHILPMNVALDHSNNKNEFWRQHALENGWYELPKDCIKDDLGDRKFTATLVHKESPLTRLIKEKFPSFFSKENIEAAKKIFKKDN